MNITNISISVETAPRAKHWYSRLTHWIMFNVYIFFTVLTLLARSAKVCEKYNKTIEETQIVHITVSMNLATSFLISNKSKIPCDEQQKNYSLALRANSEILNSLNAELEN